MLHLLDGWRTKICIAIGILSYVVYILGVMINVPTISKETLDQILTGCGLGAGWFMRSAIDRHFLR